MGIAAKPLNLDLKGMKIDIEKHMTTQPPRRIAKLNMDIRMPAGISAEHQAKLKAAADWLMCEEICVPGSANVALTLPVSADAPKPDATSGDKIRATVAGLPRADAAWKITAARAAKSVTLTVTPTAANAATAAAPANLHFFSDDGVIAFDEPQTAQPDGHGGFTVTLPLATDGPKDAKQLLGVLTTSTSWSSGATLRGLRVDTPFVAAAPPSTDCAQAPLPAPINSASAVPPRRLARSRWRAGPAVKGTR